MLLERDEPLRQLAEQYELAVSDGGRTVLVSGEAGIGKTSLIDAFVESLPDTVKVYTGGCEALFAARPLGPLFDIAEQLDGPLLAMLRSDADNHKIFSAFLGFLESEESSGAVFVIEDIHWADNATMDFLKFIARRIARSHCLLLASYRDDEIGPGHPLHYVLGDLPRASTLRIGLAPLSQDAIQAIGHCDERDARRILNVTGGNPFFVQETFQTPDTRVPQTVTEAILAKAARLPDDARQLLNLVSVVPRQCEIFLLEAAFPNALELLDACAEQGLLTVDRQFAAFRHELARLAIEDALATGQRSKWNSHVLAELQMRLPDASARLAHHADMSGRHEAVLNHAPRAAMQAAMRGAHREAVALYRMALTYADAMPDEMQLDLLECLSYELYVTGRIEESAGVRKQCLDLSQSIRDSQCAARSYRWLSRLHWFLGRRDAADRYAEKALQANDDHDGSEYAMACSNRAQLYMLSNEVPKAVDWANKAIAIGTENDDVDVLAHALNNLGTALGNHAPEDGLPYLERSLELSLDNGFQEHAARAYTNLSCILVSTRNYDDAMRFLEAGISYSSDRDLDSWLYYMLGWRARLRFETGDWDRAAEDATDVINNYRGAALVSSPAMTTLAQLRLRRGDPEFEDAFEQASQMVSGTREAARLAPLAAAQAEWTWLTGSEFSDADGLRKLQAQTQRLGLHWTAGELAWWARKLRITTDSVEGLPEPYDLLLNRGDWSGAADAWRDIGCPYEMALALGEGDEAAQRGALQAFTDLGAEPAAAKLRRELRDKGVRNLPSGARRSTRDNPAGLTNRQLAVLRALAEGLSDAEIAARLFISTRTVSHHVSAILGKLDVRSRSEAAAVARKLGIDTED